MISARTSMTTTTLSFRQTGYKNQIGTIKARGARITAPKWAEIGDKMLKVTGYRYRTDFDMPKFEKNFENLGQLLYYIEENATGKSAIMFPAQKKDGSFNQNFARTFSGQLRFSCEETSSGTIDMNIALIKNMEDGKILFSSGDFTDRIGHISTPMKEMLENLKAWSMMPYNFAD